MATRALAKGASGKAVREFQAALNRRAESRFYPEVAVDGEFGPATRGAFEALGWALGLGRDVLGRREISATVQAVIADPGGRTAEQLDRARQRAPKLHERTIAMDGTPAFWGLAKPLVRARERGWGGRLLSADRRAGVAEKFGKKSQVTLFSCFSRSQAAGRCPGDCGGECNPANPPGRSSHELRSDNSDNFPGHGAGSKLPWWQLGLDVGDSEGLLHHLRALDYDVKRTYPNSKKEFHHLNFTASPGRVLPRAGPNAKPATRPPLGAVSGKATGRLKGVDVSNHQPSVDWPRVAASGRAFAYAKVSEGLGSPDRVFGKRRWEEMRRAGIARGAYHFARPQKGRDPRAEVHEFLRLLKRAGGLRDGDLVPMLDLEGFGAAGKLGPRATLDWVRGFVEEMRAQIGRRPIIYTGVFWREAMGNPADDLGCRLWLAAYVEKPEQFVPAAWRDTGFTIWQHTDKGRCPGVSGNCDLNQLKGGRAALDKLRM